MKAFSNGTIGEQPTVSNRRQPVRQTRTNPARSATNAFQPQAGALAQASHADLNANPGFYPAITHFTDAITALPKEMIRHYTMLKEVDAKTHGPEALLGQYLYTALKAQPPTQQQAPQTHINAKIATHTATSNGIPPEENNGDGSQPNAHDDPATLARRGHFHNMGLVMFEMLQTLDEKNHVLNTAIDSLDKQLKRCESSYPYIEEEISEEARYGSLTHWAYTTDKSAEKKGMIAGERTRRAANTAAAAQQDADGAALRSEARREALAARKHRNQHNDSDFDDGRAPSKIPKSGGKGRKAAAETNLGTTVGLGIVNGAAPPSKRRKVEKVTAGLPAERAMASVYGSNGGTGRGPASSPKDIPGTEAAGKKRGRGGSLVANGTGRKRTNTNASNVNPSSIASSPVVASFAPAKDRGGRSPAPSTMQRLPSARARQNSTQSVAQLARNRSSSTNLRTTNGNGLHNMTADVEKVSGLTGRSVGDVKNLMKETVNAKGEHLVEDIGTADGAGDLRGGLVVGSRNPDRLKREETENGSSRTRGERPPSISVSTRGGNSKGPSKTATPISTSFAEPNKRPRASEAPLKRSHKKGAGLAAQMAAAAAVQDGEDSSMQGEDDEEDGPGQERYCYCDEVSYGEMVGCDNENCKREWFHLSCVGLNKAPAKNAKWYCDECKEILKGAKFNGGNGNGNGNGR